MFNVFYNICVVAFAGLSFFLAYGGKLSELAGWVIAGAIALAFLKLDSFKEFSGGGFTAKLNERVEQIETDLGPIKSKETEPNPTNKSAGRSPDDFFLEKSVENVLFALTNGKYSWRTLDGLLKETKLEPQTLEKILMQLAIDGLATTNPAGGRTLWGATQLGYAVDQLHYPGSDRGNA